MMRSARDIEDYYEEAILSIPIDHPYNKEIRSLLVEQVNDELDDYVYSRAD